MTPIDSKRGLLALMVAHCAGMIDLVALPVWVGTLVAHYRFDPQQAGGLVTLFLIGAALASVLFAPRFTGIPARTAALAGFTVGALAFTLSANSTHFAVLAVLHFGGGLAAGTALSFTHGTIGRSRNPHRVFALAGLAIGLFGIVFLGVTPGLVQRLGGPTLFVAFALVMATAALTTLLFFPAHGRASGTPLPSAARAPAPFRRGVWFAIAGVALLATTQAMTISFFERIGSARDFGLEMVTLALVIYGIVTLFPAPIAALLEKRLQATTVLCTLPVLQAVFALLITHTSSYVLYAAGGALMVFTIIFTHTFAFGLLARLDPSGRAAAGTPAMLMTGAAIGPILGGTLVKFAGFEAIGYAAVVLVALELLMFQLTRRAIRDDAPVHPVARALAPRA